MMLIRIHVAVKAVSMVPADSHHFIAPTKRLDLEMIKE